MWNYNNQIRVRWISFILAGLLLGGIFAALSNTYPEGINRQELKQLITQASVYSEFFPLYFWPLIFLGFVMLLTLGMPAILMFSPLFLVTGFTVAIITTVIAQSFSSIIAIFLARKKGWSSRIPNYVLAAVVTSGATPGEISFWARLYLSYPLRTIDLITAALMKEKEKAHRVYPSIFAGILVRTLIPCIWASSLLDMGKSISINPSADSNWFLICSSVLIAYAVLPKIPEFIICKSSLKPVLIQIESWNQPTGDYAVSESAKRPRNRVKLGMQARAG